MCSLQGNVCKLASKIQPNQGWATVLYIHSALSRGKKGSHFLFMMIIIFNFLSVHVSLQCMCTWVCAYVYVCIWRTEINVKCLFSVTLRAHYGCLEPTSGQHSHSHSHGRLFTVEPSPQCPHFLFSTIGRYLGSAFVSLLIITSRFEVRGNSRTVELAGDFRVTPSKSYCASE